MYMEGSNKTDLKVVELEGVALVHLAQLGFSGELFCRH